MATLVWIATGCNRTTYSSIPDAYVFIQVNLSTYYIHLNAPNSSECFVEDDINVNEQNYNNFIQATGYGGVIVYAAPTTNINNLTGVDYYAYDMACPYEADPDVRVYPEGYPDNKNSIHAVCQECGSRFDLSSLGMAASEDNLSKENLKRHEAVRVGNVLTVTQRYD